jgi:hypothetical protein
MTAAQAPEQGSSASDVSDRAELIGLMAGKADSLGSQVTSLLPKMENVIGVAVAVLVGAVTLGVTQKHPVILVLLPFPLIVLFAYLLQSNTEMLSRAGHKRFLEEAVNELMRRRVLLEESDVAPTTLHGSGRFGRFGRPSIVMVQSFMVILLLGAVGLAVAHLGAVRETAWRLAFWVALAAGLGLLVAAVSEQGRAYGGGYEAAKAGFGGAPEPADALVERASASTGSTSEPTPESRLP